MSRTPGGLLSPFFAALLATTCTPCTAVAQRQAVWNGRSFEASVPVQPVGATSRGIATTSADRNGCALCPAVGTSKGLVPVVEPCTGVCTAHHASLAVMRTAPSDGRAIWTAAWIGAVAGAVIGGVWIKPPPLGVFLGGSTGMMLGAGVGLYIIQHPRPPRRGYTPMTSGLGPRAETGPHERFPVEPARSPYCATALIAAARPSNATGEPPSRCNDGSVIECLLRAHRAYARTSRRTSSFVR